MPYKGQSRIDLEFGFYDLIAVTKGVSALLAAASTIEATPTQLAAMIDMIAEKQHKLFSLAGFDTAQIMP